MLPNTCSITLFYLGVVMSSQKLGSGPYNITSACFGEITTVFLSTPSTVILLADTVIVSS